MKLHKLSIKNYKALKDIDFINFNESKDYLPTIVRYRVDDYIKLDNLILKT